ncbi:MAG: sulfur carrier protein ThiS [Planctomycetes bacterium]|nr:sulfur carrier protein ThiS [Planctomycetota bacterium]
MQVVINSQSRQVGSSMTVADLLRELETPPERVAVEINRELVTRKKFEETMLHEGDTIEIVTFVGGG